jgi:menaquinone-specific isochorismate synthase
MTSGAVADAGALVAWTVEVDDPGDLLSWLPAGEAFAFLRGGDGIVGWGEAVRLHSPADVRSGADLATDVSELLNAMTVRDDVQLAGTGPVAIASLVFDPQAAGSVVVVPKVVLGRRDGRSWLTLTTPPGAVEVPALRRRPVAATTAPPASVTAAVPPEPVWRDAVTTAVAALRAGDLDKVVLARALDVTADAPIDPRAVASRLAARFPACFTYICDGLVGASPELYVRRTGRHAESLVLAGTVRRGATPEEDAELEASLLASAKNAAEHRWAASSVEEYFGGVASDVVSNARPTLMRLANVSHLATHVEAWLGVDPPSALALAAGLHPSAAVGGSPRAEAVAVIKRLEAAPRDRYAAPIGWVDAAGDGEFAIALRCAQIAGATARLWAGAGIMADSDPDAEVAETTAKFDAVLSALV